MARYKPSKAALFCCVILGFAIVVNTKKHEEKVKHHHKSIPDLTFQDVIQNISSVNDVLKDLIKNYKHLKKLFESDEIKKSKQSSDSIEDVFEESNVIRKRNQNDDSNSKEDTINKYHVTQIYYSEEKNPENPSKNITNEIFFEKSSEEKIAEKSSEEKRNENTSEEKTAEKSTTDVNVKFDNGDKSIDSYSSGEISEKISKEKLGIRKKNTEGLEIPVFDETNEKGEAHIRNNDEAAIQRLSNSVELVKQIDLQPNGNNQSDTINIVGRNLILDNQNHMVQYNPSLRRIPAKPALIIIANSSSFDQHYNKLIDQEDDDVFINREQFKTDILRSTYGDACLKLVIRKCYKACKKVIKRVCRAYKCNKAFRSKYETNIKRGCIKYFDGDEKYSTSLHLFRAGKIEANEDFTKGGYLAAACFPYEKSTIKKKSNKKNTGEQKYLSIDNVKWEEHIPLTSKTIKPLRHTIKDPNAKISRNHDRIEILKANNETEIKLKTGPQHELKVHDREKHIVLSNETIITTNEDLNANILRGRLDKACQEISNGKCKKACSFAYTDACKVQKCNKDKRREFKKECKQNCQNAFNGGKKSTESDSGSSSGDSSSSSSSSSEGSSSSSSSSSK